MECWYLIPWNIAFSISRLVSYAVERWYLISWTSGILYRGISTQGLYFSSFIHVLTPLEAKWGKKYPVVIESWNRNWDKLSTYFKYSPAIRKLIYTTNTIEGFHRQVRKVTKTKGAFTSDMALLKLIYLTTMNIQKKWTQPLQNWSLTVSQLSITFGSRLKLQI
jgi:hypothetical protein